MSKLARKPLALPNGVSVTATENVVRISGPKGELVARLPAGVTIERTGSAVSVRSADASKQGKANLGTSWALVRNGVEGTTRGYEKYLDIEGVGFRAAIEGGFLVLTLGFEEPRRRKIPEGLEVSVEKNTAVRVAGIDKQLVGKFAAEIRELKKPEPYKGKGIRYRGEVVQRKAGKKAATTGS